MLISKCVVRHSRISIDKPTQAIILLPGRGCSAEMMLSLFSPIMEAPKLIVFSIQPEKEWYPIPNGALDQSQAILGLSENLPIIRNYILELLAEAQIGVESTTLIGFSAGAVVALTMATTYQIPFKRIFSHSGAILEPENTKSCEIPTNIVLVHRQDDSCFDWNERYLPMRDILVKLGYNVLTNEGYFGNHIIYKNDVEYIRDIICQVSS